MERLLYDFWYFSSVKSTRKEKVSLCIIAGERCSPLQAKTRVQQTSKIKDICPSAFSFDEEGAKEKAIKKKSADEELSHSAERDKGDLPLPQPPFEKGGRKLLLKSAKILL